MSKRKDIEESLQRKGLRAVNIAVRNGLLPPIKSLWCVSCMLPAQVYHHHNGYDDEHILDVIALCYKCHTLEHKRVGTYMGDALGREFEVVTLLHTGMSVAALARHYKATQSAIKLIIKTHSQLLLPSNFFLRRQN